MEMSLISIPNLKTRMIVMKKSVLWLGLALCVGMWSCEEKDNVSASKTVDSDFEQGADGWAASGNWMVLKNGVGEIRTGKLGNNQLFTTTIEPMHGNSLVVYTKDNRTVLTDRLNQGHALVAADFLGQGRDQIAMGWREKNAAEQVGVRLYVSAKADGTQWQEYALDEKANMAAEDLKAADLDGDGDLDLVAAGRATHNLVIYWNKRY